MTSISIAMATYNGERFIGEQLESLAAQTHRPRELVVCDDGSRDGTLAIVEDFARHAPFPVRVFRNEKNLGYADNFLKAASLCEGEWVAFCDQDDVWDREKFAVVAKVIARHPEVLLVAHPAALMTQDGELTGEVAWPSPERLYRRFSLPPWRSGMGCGQVFRASLVRDIPFTRRFLTGAAKPFATSPHDDWIVKLSRSLGSVYYLSRPLVMRRRHDQSVTAEKSPPLARPRSAPLRKGVAGQLALYAELARNRSEVLRFCAQAGSATYREGLLSAAAYFDTAAGVLERRAAWRGQRGLRRLGEGLGLIASPSYRRMGAGVAGWRGLARDLIDLVRKE